MIFKKFMHIEKLGTSEVEGILDGTVDLFYKIDGTNGCIFLKDDGSLGFGSRKRELTEGSDNQNFRCNILNDTQLVNKLLQYLNKYPNRIIYGEWLVPVTIKRYKKDAWNKFYIFDIMEFDSSVDDSNILDDEYTRKHERYISYDEYSQELDELGLLFVQKIATLENPTPEQINSLLELTGNFLISEGLGEGIVIKNYNYKNRYGRTTWAKVLTEDFKNSKQHLRSANKVEKVEYPVEHKIIQMLTVEHIYKEYSKLQELKGEWSSKYIPELLNRVFMEFWKDNWEIILNKHRMPTINFRILKTLSDKQVKTVLNI